MESRPIQIAGYGHYVPPGIVTNQYLESIMQTSDEFITARTGVRTRRHAQSIDTLGDLIVPAASAAVTDAGLSIDDIDMLIVNTLTPDYHDPSQACLMQDRLGMRMVPAFDIRAQCSGILYAMDIASQFISTKKCEHVLIVCAEMLSKRFDRSKEGRNLSVLLGDGAGALVMAPSEADGAPQLIDLVTHSDGEHFKLLHTAAPGCINETYLSASDIESGRHQFRMSGRAMFEHAVDMMYKVALEILQKHNLQLSDIQLVIPHQPNLRILEAVQQRLELESERLFITVREFGNMASASLPVALSMAHQMGRLRRGSLVLLLAYGAGATWGAALYRC